MRSRLLTLLLIAVCVSAWAQEYKAALPGYHYEFPGDNFDHPAYETEWWYYTGNLRAKDGHRFGFELTFFRQGVSREQNQSPWFIRDLYMAHLALSDLSGGKYYATERINREGPGIAGVDAASGLIWNGNWQSDISEREHRLRGIGENFALELSTMPEKAPVINGRNGVSQKSEGVGHASHYISFTRMKTTGTIELDGAEYAVDGDTWMDHEFFSEAMETDEVGWDWLSVQLDDNSELMLYRLRHKDGSVDAYSSGTFVDAQGKATHLMLRDFNMTPAGTTWTSERSEGKYPIAWNVDIPGLGLRLTISTALKSQEFVSRIGPSYWEGAIDVEGVRDNNRVQGSGYLEMTGHAKLGSSSAGAPLTR